MDNYHLLQHHLLNPYLFVSGGVGPSSRTSEMLFIAQPSTYNTNSNPENSVIIARSDSFLNGQGLGAEQTQTVQPKEDKDNSMDTGEEVEKEIESETLDPATREVILDKVAKARDAASAGPLIVKTLQVVKSSNSSMEDKKGSGIKRKSVASLIEKAPKRMRKVDHCFTFN